MVSLSEVTVFGVLFFFGATFSIGTSTDWFTEYGNQLRELAIDCEDGKPNYVYYPYDCSKYYGCQNNSVQIFSCPAGLYWNEDVKACDVLERTNCSNIIPVPGPNCSDGTNTYWQYPYDCYWFWECVNYTLILLPCPAGTAWNDINKKCEDTTIVDCSFTIPYPNVTSSASPSTATTPTITTTSSYTTPNIDCSKGQYFPYPYDCKKYYECSNGVAKLMTCPGVLLWNTLLFSCDYPENVDCSHIISSPAFDTYTSPYEQRP